MSKTAVFLCPNISAFVNICQSYGQKYRGPFFDSQCRDNGITYIHSGLVFSKCQQLPWSNHFSCVLKKLLATAAACKQTLQL